MTELKDLKIYIVDNEDYKISIFKTIFKDIKNVECVTSDIGWFYNTHIKEIDCLVSPANAFGHMTGGYDAALSDIFGWDYQKKVQQYIIDNFYGEQLVGTSFIIDTPLKEVKLIHTPTMQYPSIIKDDMVVYHSMRATLMCALKNDIKCIVIPIFGGACGRINANIASRRMKEAYLQILNRIGPSYDI